MNLLLIIILILALFGGGGYYGYGASPYLGSGIGLIGLIIIIVLLMRGGL